MTKTKSRRVQLYYRKPRWYQFILKRKYRRVLQANDDSTIWYLGEKPNLLPPIIVKPPSGG